MRLAFAILLALLSAPLHAQTSIQFESILNAQRVTYGLPGLRPSDSLMRAAQAHANDMAQRGFFSHTGSNGSQVADRARAQGYCYRTLAENLAWGYDSPARNIEGWMNSAGHRRNILHNGITDYGVGRAGNIWVIVVGRPC